ncbi:MAG: hypothetical protein LBR44_02895 [Clostridiales Family XIII bacterium]|jgi:glucan-binding YG repeat protein|nr:hypothetical protein [Clostridiales Family XIII bacterium]
MLAIVCVFAFAMMLAPMASYAQEAGAGQGASSELEGGSGAIPEGGSAGGQEDGPAVVLPEEDTGPPEDTATVATEPGLVVTSEADIEALEAEVQPEGSVEPLAVPANAVNQWVEDGGRWYYYGADGKPVKGWQTIDGEVRYLDPAQGGAAPQGWFDHPNGYKYYFWWSGKGTFAQGAVEIGDRVYRFDEQGHQTVGWVEIDGAPRYFAPDQGTPGGAAPQGWYKHSNGKTYYFWWSGAGLFATGIAQIGGKSYYFNDQGHLSSGWQTVDGQVRYFDPAQGGAAPQGWYKHSNGKTYYFWWGGNGIFATGVAGIGGKSYYFNDQGHLSSGWQTVDGQVRYFDPAQGGAAPQGWYKHSNGKMYYFWWGGNGIFATGLAGIGGQTYYFNPQGHLTVGWQTVNGQVRYFAPELGTPGGAAPQGWYKHSNGQTYYFWWGGQGVFATGLAKIGTPTYAFNTSGHLMRNASAVVIGNYKVWTDANGVVTKTEEIAPENNADITVEADIIVTGTGSGWHGKLVIQDGTTAVSFGIQHDNHSALGFAGKDALMFESVSNSPSYHHYQAFKEVSSGWHRIRLEWYRDKAIAKGYCDGIYVGEVATKSMGSGEIAIAWEAIPRVTGDTVDASFKNTWVDSKTYRYGGVNNNWQAYYGDFKWKKIGTFIDAPHPYQYYDNGCGYQLWGKADITGGGDWDSHPTVGARMLMTWYRV